MANRFRPWATGLPPAAAAEIVRRLSCSADRGRMAAVCRDWRTLAAAIDRPVALPWLILPGADSSRLHCVPCGLAIHHKFVAPPHGSRCFGADDDSWVFVASNHQAHTHSPLKLGDATRVHALPDTVQSEKGATISAPPDDPGCVGACIISPGQSTPGLRRFCFWRTGSTVALDLRPDPELPKTAPCRPTPAELEAEDVAYYGDSFHVLTRGEHIFVFQPPPVGDKIVPVQNVRLKLFDQPRGRNYGDLVVRGRYLVVCGAELLMVVTLSHGDELMSSFKVFRMIPPKKQIQMHQPDDPDEVDEYPWSWSELDTLDGCVLFLGRGCSRSYRASDCQGLDAGILFCDDHSFYDEGMMFCDGSDRQFSCMVNGGWSEGPPPRIRYFLTEGGASSCSHPAWILPHHPTRDLPMDIVEHIVGKVRCDTHGFHALRALGLKLEDLVARRQLPWLVLPAPSGDGLSVACLTCGNSVQSAIHQVDLPAKFFSARYFGSFDQRWVFFAPDDADHKALNIFSGHMYTFPSLVTLATEDGSLYGQIILAAALSQAPDDQDCIGAAVIRYRNNPASIGGPLSQISIWHMDSQIAVDPNSSTLTPVHADDIIFYKGELHYVTWGEQLMVWTPNTSSNGVLNVRDNWRVFFLEHEVDHLDEQYTRTRYLVQSRQELLLVVKYAEASGLSSASTEAFRVFHMIVPEADIGNGGPMSCPCINEELEGRMLFVGRGCSRSYEVADYPGFKEGIYYFDDFSFMDDAMLSPGVSSGARQYTCSENGKWVMDSGFEQCYPHMLPSTTSSPAWILP